MLTFKTCVSRLPRVTNALAAITMAAMTAATTAGSVLLAPGAAAQVMPGPGQRMFCGKRADIVGQLGRKYGETRRSLGLTGRRGVVEVFASDATGSWTILVTNPQGLTCLMAAGEAFETLPVEAAGSPA